MNTDRLWLAHLGAVIASSGDLQDLPAFELGLHLPNLRCGIDMGSGRVTDGVNASCVVSAREDIVEALVRGEITLQSAYLSRAVELSGDPEHLLRLSVILDKCAAIPLGT